jgi:HlyD family secretion protein
LKVDNSSLALRPGMTATALLTVNKRENAVQVPNTALRFAPPPAPVAPKQSGGSLFSKIFPHPPHPEPNQRADSNNKTKEQKVWTVRDGQLTPITITKGLTDGQWTEVTSGGLEPGTELVTDMVTQK